MAKPAKRILSDSGKFQSLAAELQPFRSPHQPLQISSLKSLFPFGLFRGLMVEVSGARSSGRASTCMQILAAATQRGEICALVDGTNSFSPKAAASAGVCLSRLLWVRCGGDLHSALRVTDLLLHAGGFGVICLDLCEMPLRLLNRIPISYWYRYQRALEHTQCICLAVFDLPQVRSSRAVRVELQKANLTSPGNGRFQYWDGIRVHIAAEQPFEQPQAGWVQFEG